MDLQFGQLLVPFMEESKGKEEENCSIARNLGSVVRADLIRLCSPGPSRPQILPAPHFICSF